MTRREKAYASEFTPIPFSDKYFHIITPHLFTSEDFSSPVKTTIHQ
jgi:hypothetical protein